MDKDALEQLTKERSKLFMARVAYFQALKGVNDTTTASGMGVSRQMFYLYRKGESFPTLEKILQLAHFLNCDIDDLLKKEV